MREACLLLAISVSLLAGCAVSPRSIPESLSPEVINDYHGVCREASGDGVRIRAGGIRLVPDGAIVDLVIAAPAEWQQAAAGIGETWSLDRQPNRFVEIRDPAGGQVRLLPWRRDDSPVRLRTIQFRRPPQFVLEKDGDHVCLVQTAIFRVAQQLNPGAYEIQLLPPAQAEWRSARVIGEHLAATSAARELQVDGSLRRVRAVAALDGTQDE